MHGRNSETLALVIPFASKKGSPDATMVADDAGQHIVALVQLRDRRALRPALVHKAL